MSMINKTQISRYSNALLEMKTRQVHKMRSYKNPEVAVLDSDLDAYFQILWMSELCNELLLFQNTGLLTRSLNELTSWQDWSEALSNRNIVPVQKGVKYYAGVIATPVVAVLMIYILSQWLLAVLAAQLLLALALTMAIVISYGFLVNLAKFLGQAHSVSDCNLIQSFDSEAKQIPYPKEYIVNREKRIPCQKTPYELSQGFFARKEGEDKSLAEQTFEYYQTLS